MARRLLAGTRFVLQVAVAAVALAAATLLVLPKAMGWQGVIVLTGSMEPTLEVGGVAFVDPVRPEQVHKGDVITFTRPNSRQQVTHRVIEVFATSDGPRYRTKGDANSIPDDWVVTPEQLVGRVRFALPYMAGAVSLLVEERSLLGILMAIPAAFLVADEIRRWRRERRDRRTPPSTRPRRTRARPLVYVG
ncbi:MAG: signal peptidase I [Actinomycetota bacterium]|nr:signal peptidase I [Actinomycetota bacterium]